MTTKKLLPFLLFFGTVLLGHAQDLVRKIPADANFLITVNNRAVFKHLDIEDVNQTFTRLGLFDKVFKADADVSKLQDLGVDFSSKAYFFGETTDSVQYIGGLIPLSDVSLFESVLSQKDRVELVNGLKSIYSADRTFRVSWDKHTLYLLGGISVSYFFDREEVKDRYQLPDSPYNSYESSYYDDYSIMGEPADEWTVEEDWYNYDEEAMEVLHDSILTHVDTLDWDDSWAYELDIAEDAAMRTDTIMDSIDYDDWWDDYSMVDSVLSRDEYSDDYYTKYREYTQQRDSVINTLVHAWVDERLNSIIEGDIVSYTVHKSAHRMSDNTIADIKVRNIATIYSAYYPIDILTAIGMGSTSDLPAFDYGIEDMAAQLVVDRNKLIMKADMGLDKEMARYYKDIYSKKINRKFLSFLDEETLGFVSFNIDTEAYLKHIPKILERYYGPLAGQYSDYISLGVTLFDVLIDEKAVAKVFKGDNLFVLNGVTQVEVNYTDYEYDNDFNYAPVEKTKMETIPHFVWVFSSDDTRLFTNMIAVTLREGGVVDMDGIYALKQSYHSPFQLYVLIKDGMVFLGNDLDQLSSIKDNRVSGKGYRPYANMARKNNFSMLFNTKRLPELIQDLEIPLSRSMEVTVQEMSQYGDFYILSSGIKKNRVHGEMGIEVPNNKGNALAFLFGILDRWSMDGQ